jgi:hypothetical protein
LAGRVWSTQAVSKGRRGERRRRRKGRVGGGRGGQEEEEEERKREGGERVSLTRQQSSAGIAPSIHILLDSSLYTAPLGASFISVERGAISNDPFEMGMIWT